MKNNTVAWMTKNAILAAIYVVLTIAFAPISYGAVQFRISEFLVMLPWFNKKWIPGIVLGTAIANMFSPLGVVDVLFGTLATLLSVILVSHMRNLFIATLAPAVVNGLVIGVQLYLVFGAPLVASMIYVALGEFVVVLIAAFVFRSIANNSTVSKLLNG